MFKRTTAVSGIMFAACAFASTANAATTVDVDTSNPDGWTIQQPLAKTPVDAVSVTNGLPSTWDSSAPWISTTNSGATDLPPGVSGYIFTLETPTWLRSLSGKYWADNQLIGIMVQNALGWVALPFTPNPSTTQFTVEGRDDRTFSFFGGALEGAGTVSAIKFQVDNNVPRNSVSKAGFAVEAIATAVPEPGTWLLMILGLGAVGFAMRRQQKSLVRMQFA